jgi:hypothetical protein
MSAVSGIVLCSSCCEERGSQGEDGMPLLFEQINKWLSDRSGGGASWSLEMVENHFGGSKHPQMSVAGGGFNHFCENEFADYVLGLSWQNPENVVLVIEPEEGETRIFRPHY